MFLRFGFGFKLMFPFTSLLTLCACVLQWLCSISSYWNNMVFVYYPKLEKGKVLILGIKYFISILDG